MDWIISDGGPLICLESKWKTFWGGIERLTVGDTDVLNDYERACKVARNYTTVLPVANGSALILGGELGADTSIWRARSGVLFVAQVPYSEPDEHEETYLAALNEADFLKPVASAEMTVTSDDMILFDSADPGDDISGKSLSFCVDPGRYRILSQIHNPSSNITFLLHKFEKVSVLFGL